MHKDDPAWVFWIGYSLGVPLIVGTIIGLIGLPPGQISIMKDLLVPIIGALLAGWFVWHQTSETAKRAKDQQVKRNKAIRAVMPLTLSKFVVHTIDQFDVLAKVYDQLKDRKLVADGGLRPPKIKSDVISLDASVITVLTEMIEFSDEEVGDYITKFLNCYQIYQTRRDEFVYLVDCDFMEMNNRLAIIIFQTGEIRAIAEIILKYSQNWSEPPPIAGPTKMQIKTATKMFFFQIPRSLSELHDECFNKERDVPSIWDEVSKGTD